MSLSKRIQLYRKIEQERGRPLIAYVTSQRANASGKMGADVVPEICDQVLALPQKTQAVDILIVSSGGDPMVAWRTISVLREKVKTIGVLIPQSAYSAATLLALGADEIVMHPCGNLGPLDPQITINHRDAKGNNEAIQYSAEDLLAFLNFAKKEVGIKDQSCLLEAFKMATQQVGPTAVGFTARSTNLSLNLGLKLLQTHREKREEKNSRAIVSKLNKEFFAHGYPLSRTEAKEIGLHVTFPNSTLEKLMWDTWQAIEEDMKCRVPFSPMDAFITSLKAISMKMPASSSTAPAPNGAVPAPAIVSANMAVSTIHAMLESVQLQRMYIVDHDIQGVKDSTGAIQANVATRAGCWRKSIDAAS